MTIKDALKKNYKETLGVDAVGNTIAEVIKDATKKASEQPEETNENGSDEQPEE